MNDPEIYGKNLLGQTIKRTIKTGALGKRFMVPPFSVLNAREGAWQSRKRAWLALGIESEIGRKGSSTTEQTNDLRGALTYRITNNAYASPVKKKEPRLRGLLYDWEDRPKEKKASQGTSIFDPVLCELAYRWFCPVGGTVIDPFAGGSVRGIVAGMLGLRYWGCDLSKEQVVANQVQHQEICPDADIVWKVGDAEKRCGKAPRADFIFTCPPYGNLERYSDDPRDLSTMTVADFNIKMEYIAEVLFSRLRNNRFAAIVVANYRNERGSYVDLVGDTIRAFEHNGFDFYNEAILVTAIGSLAVRTRVQFVRNRKLGKGHQQMLVFLKGDGKKATKSLTC